MTSLKDVKVREWEISTWSECDSDSETDCGHWIFGAWTGKGVRVPVVDRESYDRVVRALENCRGQRNHAWHNTSFSFGLQNSKIQDADAEIDAILKGKYGSEKR